MLTLSMLGIDSWMVLWLVFLIVFIIGELVTVGLTSIWFAAGSLIALIAAALGWHPVIQFILFLGVSVGTLMVTKPLAKKYINSKMQSTNADRIIGESIRIAERVSNLDQTGMAVVHGQEWTVRSRDDNQIIEAGELARVIQISGVKLIVEKE